MQFGQTIGNLVHDFLQMQDFSEAFLRDRWTKRPQRCAALGFRGHRAETRRIEAHPDALQIERTHTTMTFAPSPPTHHDSQLVFTSSQAARYLGVSLATIRRWADAGHLDCYRTPGGQRRFSREQLDGFVDSLQRSGDAGSHPTQRAA